MLRKMGFLMLCSLKTFVSVFIIIGSEESLIGGLGSGHLREKHHYLAGSDLVRVDCMKKQKYN